MREFLKGLDFDAETIDTIMAEHGKYLTGLKEQVDNYKQEIEDYKSQINELNSKVSENEESLKNLQNLTNENNDLKAEIQLGGSNVKKEFSKFVRTEVMGKVNDETDFASALEDFKRENPQYFGETVIKKVQSSPNLNNGGNQPTTTNDIMNDILRSVRKDN